ncbi:MAG: EAL domain-containing protein [Lachnospiraceae bacterium]|nr:EAL domain-containing protein [Lachnospiraceae bacterium]
MSDTHNNYQLNTGKRLILIAEDESVNREILGMMLQSDYRLLFAEDGTEVLRQVEEHHRSLSLILLDMIMPGLHGLEVMRRLKEHPDYRSIPVIVLTSDQNLEVECLSLGAIDFIPKPYPKPEVVLARVRRTIEFIEDRQILDETERDPLTGLYNRGFFYKYVEQYDELHRDVSMDAVFIDFNHFHMLNERYGKACGDEVLRLMGERLKELLRETGGLACRRQADSFLAYIPHGRNHDDLYHFLQEVFLKNDAVAGLARLRMGVYSDADRSIDIERRFDRAKIASDSVRNTYMNSVALYDKTLHEEELFNTQIIEDFHAAIRDRQFRVHYQPKFDVRPDRPYLVSAEALVRWEHPTLGSVSPGRFISLFEKNGMIWELDRYVWREAARQVREWKDRFGFTVPVSVNISRVDIYDPGLVEVLTEILEEFGLTPDDFYIEITESAYTNDAELIIRTVTKVRELGFRVEMDDFGTGYSSLGMISSLPIDALKLDMMFVRNAFGGKKDVKMLELVIDIADYLGVPVIAEGVETEEQLIGLRTMGVDVVQGYYFGKPVPAADFEKFILARMEDREADRMDSLWEGKKVRFTSDGKDYFKTVSNITYTRIAQALTHDYFTVFYINTDDNHYMEYMVRGPGHRFQLVTAGDDFFSEAQKRTREIVRKEDRRRVSSALLKENLIRETAEGQTFTMTYGRLVDGKMLYVNLKGQRLMDDPSYTVIGVSNVDAQMRREEERRMELDSARAAVNRDALTGVKSKHAYVETTKEINGKILSGKETEFAVAVCDINGLKHVNDTCGHQAGDEFIRKACMEICDIFKHSPVFRIGGDEFAAILRGQDYQNRAALIERLALENARSLGEGGVIVACGMSEYRMGADADFGAVFDRADAAMYENKTMLKSRGAADR